jgi:hypothetical protein
MRFSLKSTFLACLIGSFAVNSLLAGPASEAQARIAKVENKGLLFTDNSAGVSGVDGYFSLPMGYQTVWFFGDVFLLDPTSPEKPWVGNVSNCALLTPSGKGIRGLSQYQFLTDPKTGCARPILPNKSGEDNSIRFWPLAAYYDEVQRAVFLYYMRIEAHPGGGPLDFSIAGYGLAKSDARDPAKMRFERINGASGEELWGRTEKGPLFGITIVCGAPGTNIYVFGYRERKGSRPGVLARVSKKRIADQKAYEYFSGTATSPRWSGDVNDAADIAGLTDIASVLSVAYNKYLGGYLAVHQKDTSEQIRFCIAKEPWGPYQTIGEIAARHKAFAKSFCYDGAEHPELAEENGRIVYVTFVDSDRYWQQLYKVTLQK